jgi:hypothetical protein
VKKAELELEEAKISKELLEKHSKACAKAKTSLKLREVELENREALVKARMLQATAKREEAKALRRGNKKKAEERKREACSQRAIALMKETEISENNAKERPSPTFLVTKYKNEKYTPQSCLDCFFL